MSNWLTRPGYIAVLAFLAGGAITGAIVLFIAQCTGDDDGSPSANGTPELTETPGATPDGTAAPPPTAGPAATATFSPSLTPEAALEAYVQDELDGEYGGPCSAGPPIGTYCSAEISRGADLATFLIGLANSEFFLEAVLTRNEDDTWSIDVFTLPDPTVPLSIGATAIVHQTGDCLNFREGPSISAALRTCQLDGTRGAVIDGPVDADGITWWNIEGYGWGSAEYLGVAP